MVASSRKEGICSITLEVHCNCISTGEVGWIGHRYKLPFALQRGDSCFKC